MAILIMAAAGGARHSYRQQMEQLERDSKRADAIDGKGPWPEEDWALVRLPKEALEDATFQKKQPPTNLVFKPLPSLLETQSFLASTAFETRLRQALTYGHLLSELIKIEDNANAHNAQQPKTLPARVLDGLRNYLPIPIGQPFYRREPHPAIGNLVAGSTREDFMNMFRAIKALEDQGLVTRRYRLSEGKESLSLLERYACNQHIIVNPAAREFFPELEKKTSKTAS